MSAQRDAVASALLAVVGHCSAGSALDPLSIPTAAQIPPHAVTINDVLTLRHIDTLSLSPDGRHFAAFVHQADVNGNRYRSGWFIGGLRRGDAFVSAGNGGEVGRDDGGVIYGRESRWSPDSQWLAYTLERQGEIQLWRSRADGSGRQQLTHSRADVIAFAWNPQGDALYFNAGVPREQVAAETAEKERRGYRYDEEVYVFTQFMAPPWPAPNGKNLVLNVVDVDTGEERLANESEKKIFDDIKASEASGLATMGRSVGNEAVLPIHSRSGTAAWLERIRPQSMFLRLVAESSKTGTIPKTCPHEACSGFIPQIWWSADGERVLFYRRAGVEFSSFEFLAWEPSSGALHTVRAFPDDDFQHCVMAPGDQLVCSHESATQPQRIVALDLRSGQLRVLTDINPEFGNITLGKTERIEWNTPKFAWNEPKGALEGQYNPRTYGYLLYPPDFDPTKKYPLFIDPYYAKGFECSIGGEHAQHVYAANGIVVLKATFPSSIDALARLGSDFEKKSYSAELGFPHLSMLMESTAAALETVAQRGFIDRSRVGIGGVSHGSFVPLYLLQKHDLIAAISISSPGWSPNSGYFDETGLTRKLAEQGAVNYTPFMPAPDDGPGREFWRAIDIADHVDAVEAPILMQLAAHEAFGLVPFIRRLADARKPYDAYLFPNETHLKWQPAHLQAIMNRNLDWFRFWLQDYEDPAPAKADQYVRWRELRALQCHNPWSLRDYCDKAK